MINTLIKDMKKDNNITKFNKIRKIAQNTIKQRISESAENSVSNNLGSENRKQSSDVINRIKIYENPGKINKILMIPHKESRQPSNLLVAALRDLPCFQRRLLDLRISTVDRKKKTFVLKNDRNFCMTYCEKVLILSECKKTKRQVFKLVDADTVTNS